MRITIIIIFIVFIGKVSSAQQSFEQLHIPWPDTEKWEVVQEKEDSLELNRVYMPAGIKRGASNSMCIIKVMKGMNSSNITEIGDYYRQMTGKGSVLTMLDSLEGKSRWLLFKIETPASKEFPIAESDLYYVLQGEYGVYEVLYATKSSKLDPQKQKKWTEIFKRTRLQVD